MLNTALQVGLCANRAEGDKHLLWLTGHTVFHVAQETFGFPTWKCLLSAHIELLLKQQPQILLHRVAALNLFSAQPVFVLGIALTEVQDLALNFMRFTQAHFSNLHKPLWMVSLPSNLSSAQISLVLW